MISNNLQGELLLMNSLGIKPNYAQLAKEYDTDWRTVKKYHQGYKGKPKSRNKASRLDKYKAQITDKLTIRRITVKGVYEFMVGKYCVFCEKVDNVVRFKDGNICSDCLKEMQD